MTVQLIVFDFDGTIADTHSAFVNIVNRLSGQFGYQPVSQTEVDRMRHLSSRAIVAEARVPLWKLPFLLRKVTTELGNDIANILPIKGIDSALIEIKKHGYRLGILTSNSKKNVLSFLDKNKLTELFDFIDSGTGIFQKDKAIDAVLRRHKLTAQQFIYVGDETRDIEAAKKRNVRIIAVSWGFNSPEVLAKYQPNCLVSTPQELVSAIEALRSQEMYF